MACQKPGNSPQAQSPAVNSLTGAQILQQVQRSEKPYVLVNFYATYCKPCLKEIPDLLKLYHDKNSPVEVIFVSLDDDDGPRKQDFEEKLYKFSENNHLPGTPNHFAVDSARAFIYRLFPGWNSSIPLNMVFARSGRLVEKTGLTDRGEIEMIVSQDMSFYDK